MARWAVILEFIMLFMLSFGHVRRDARTPCNGGRVIATLEIEFGRGNSVR